MAERQMHIAVDDASERTSGVRVPLLAQMTHELSDSDEYQQGTRRDNVLDGLAALFDEAMGKVLGGINSTRPDETTQKDKSKESEKPQK